MKRSISTFERFDKKFKRLSKKYQSLKQELIELSNNLLANPKQGSNLGSSLYKIRLASKSKGGGKSGGFRIITYYIEKNGDDEVIYLVTIYDKSEEDSIDKTDLQKIVKDELT